LRLDVTPDGAVAGKRFLKHNRRGARTRAVQVEAAATADADDATRVDALRSTRCGDGEAGVNAPVGAELDQGQTRAVRLAESGGGRATVPADVQRGVCRALE
jgi:hypothetical protein